MLNNVILVGRVVDEPKLIILDSGYKVTHFTMAIQKPFRNENNEYETDFIPVQAWMLLAEVICDYIGKGSIIGCRCRLSTRIVEVGEIKVKAVEVIAERLSFISVHARTDKPSTRRSYEKVKGDIVNVPPDVVEADDFDLENNEEITENTPDDTGEKKEKEKNKKNK